MSARIAFFGLGIMGSGMVRRLIAAGFPVRFHTRDPEKAAAFAAEGGRPAASPGDAVIDAEYVVSMVADDAASRATWLGPQGALAEVRRGAVLIECSTLSIGWVRELAAAAAAKGCELLDAPVTGTQSHAAAGELRFLVGGSAAALEKARPVLAAMGKSVVHMGGTGTGAMMKLVNNFLCGVQAASLAEAIGLMERSGLDREKALDVLLDGAPGSPLFKTIAARGRARDFTPVFRLRLMAKDLTYALNEGRQNGSPMTTADAALRLFREAIQAGNGEKDFSAILEQLLRSPAK
ncbi:MAG TPA: NAD(P)-dependent oxidoreductase [Verrucomicrobiota bacterium]|nr:NAD(P)-dependent oxidoreductase [Verrucomicrobiota bacterium]